MRKITVIIAVFALAAAGLLAQGTTILKIKTQVANVRSGPDVSAAVIKRLGIGTLIESSGKTGEWFTVTVTDDQGATRSGYINAGAVDVVSTAPGQPAAARPEPAPAGNIPSAPADQPPVAVASRPLPGTMLFGRYGSFAPSDSIFKSVYGSGAELGGELRFRVGRSLYASLNGGYYSKSGLLTVTQESTKITIMPIEAMIIYHVLQGTISPYVGAGAAAANYKEENVIGTITGFGFGFAVCGGATARFGILAVDARVKYSSIKVKPAEDEAGLGGLTLSVGAGLIF